MGAGAKPALSPLAFGVGLTLIGLYLGTAAIAAARDGDFVHLWLGGAMAAGGGGAAMYDPAAQHAVLAGAFADLGLDAVPDGLWASRNALVGAFFYPPPAGALYAPLGALPLRSAALIAAVLHVAAGVLCAGGVRALTARAWGPVACLALVLCLPSFFYGFVLGQNGAWTGGALLLAAVALLRGRDVLAGVCVGLLIFKPSWWLAAAWVPIWLAARPTRALGGLALGTVGACIVSLPLGLDAWRAWFAIAPQVARLSELPDYPLHLQYNLASMAARWGLPMIVGHGVAVALAVACALRSSRLERPRAVALCLVAATLLNPHLHHYDMVPMVGGLAVLLTGVRLRWAVPLIVAHHAAFVLVDVLDLSAWLPLPTLAALVVLAGLAWRPAGLSSDLSGAPSVGRA